MCTFVKGEKSQFTGISAELLPVSGGWIMGKSIFDIGNWSFIRTNGGHRKRPLSHEQHYSNLDQSTTPIFVQGKWLFLACILCFKIWYVLQ